MGGCQNYGPFLGTLNTRCRIIGIQEGTIFLTTTHILYWSLYWDVGLCWGPLNIETLTYGTTSHVLSFPGSTDSTKSFLSYPVSETSQPE